MLLKQNHLLGFLILGSVAAAESAFATVNFGTSKGFGADVSPGLIPTPYAFGEAPAPYTSEPLPVSPLNYSAGSFTLGASEVAGFAISDVNGLPGVRTTTGSGSAKSVTVLLHSGLFGNSGMSGALYLTADTLASGSEVTGEYGSLTRLGVPIIANLSLFFDPSLVGDPNTVFNLSPGVIAPNTNLFPLLTPGPNSIIDALLFSGYGSIILNEQSGLCNGINSCEIGVSALHIYGVNDAHFGLSYAKQTAVVPEASTSSMMLVGLGLVGAMVARSRKHIQAVALT